MKAGKRLIACVLTASSLMLGGCGATVTELSDEEEDIVVYYAAKIVAKHNVRLGQGVIRYLPPKEAEQPAEEEAAAEEEQTEEADTTTDAAADTNTAAASDITAEEEQTEEKVSLTEAMGIDGISFKYKGAKAYKNFTQKNLAMRSPASGNRYVVITVSIKNKSADTRKVSMLSQAVKFTAQLGDQTQNAQATMSLEDLPTYEKTLKSGESDKAIILFEFSEDNAKDLSGLSLTVEKNGTQYSVKL